jgi:hypothetical protein
MQEVRSSILLGSIYNIAKVAELVYALVSKTSSFTAVRVRFPPLALIRKGDTLKCPLLIVNLN